MYSYRLVKFPNGLRVLMVPDKNIETVQVTVGVRAGSLYEPKEINGISHFLEHVAFKGTKKRPTSLDLSLELDSIGANYNAFTGHEYTGYYVKVSKKYLKLAIDILADIYLHSTYPEAEIEKEKGVIIEEINMYHDDPMSYVWDIWSDLLYGDSPAGREIIGTKETVSKIRRQDLINYHSSLYRAKGSFVVVSGNFKEKEALKIISHYFKEIRPGEGYKIFPTVEKQTKPGLKIKFRNTDQTHLVLGVRSFSYFDSHRYSLDILNTMLGTGFSSLLFQLVREKLGAAYYLHSHPYYFFDHGFWSINCGLNNDKIISALSSILKEWKGLMTKYATVERLKNAKNNVAGQLWLYLENSHQYARYLATDLLLKNEIETPNHYISQINKITLSDIKKTAKILLKPERLNLAMVGPYKETKNFQKILNF